MNRLSSPLSRLSPRYDVVVIGSGYGGAITACRLAHSKHRETGKFLSVCILERGLERQPGEYPSTPLGALAQLQVQTPRGHIGARTALYDIRIDRDMSAFVGCSLGGTSIVNANVLLTPDDFVTNDERWPAALRSDSRLTSGYARAVRTLGARPYPKHWPILDKFTALAKSANADERATHPLIAVSFETKVNIHGVPQRACTLCGDCVTGCNFSAKNTLIMNYLPEAKNAGAEIFCGIEVRSVEEVRDADAGGYRYLVHFRVIDRGLRGFRAQEMFIAANTVIVAAGSFGSTEIMHRSRARGLAASGKVGTGFTGNGDVIAFTYNTEERVNGVGRGRDYFHERTPGPTITGLVDEREGKGEAGIIIEEGAIPGALALPLRMAFPIASRVLGATGRTGVHRRLRQIGRELVSLVAGARHGALQNTQTLLVMAHEGTGNAGRLTFVNDCVRISWPGVGHKENFRKVARRLAEMSRRLGGRHVVNPLWSRWFGRRLITVHPLGGCIMAESGTGGVVDHTCKVFRGDDAATHEALYVCDGSVIPRSLGTNPLLTISAIAERTADIMIEEHGLVEDEWRTKQIANQPHREAELPPPVRIGMRFAERMRGHYKANGTRFPIELTLTIGSGDAERFVREPGCDAEVLGVARAPGLSSSPIMVRGRFELFTWDPTSYDTRLMKYELDLHLRDGRTFVLDGRKRLVNSPKKWDLWPSFTQMHFRIRPQQPDAAVDTAASAFEGAGVARIRFGDLPRMLRSITFTGPCSMGRRAKLITRFLFLYSRMVVERFTRPFGPEDMIDPYKPVPETRQLAVSVSYGPKEVDTRDGARISMRCYRRDNVQLRGPVLLAPGFGTSTLVFRMHTLRESLVEYLCAKGYEVWLVDWRASELSGSSDTQFTIDAVAQYDFPAAIEHALAHTNVNDADGSPARSVQFLGHCVGSAALMMMLLKGYDKQRVRSAICSQFFTHVDVVRLNRAKARLRLANIIHAGGLWPTLTPQVYADRTLWAKTADRILQLYPTPHPCRNPVCLRIRFLYGEVNNHAQLDRATHSAMHEMFNRANLTTFQQIAHILRARKLVDAQGRDEYVVGENVRRLRTPITLLQGEKNLMFRPAGGQASLEWLQANASPDHPDGMFEMRVLPDYGHMDLFIGRDASLPAQDGKKNPFEVIVAELERGERVAASLRAKHHEPAFAGG